ncbi:MAG: hypothetical protein GC168_15245 [Candidatus Hydrogenedens sp.]|nr:hypothetical protein [Candidatus Hydrogenedens sp.]
MKRLIGLHLGALCVAAILTGCPPAEPDAPGIYAKMGEPLPSATPEQLATFDRGLAVMQHRFDLKDGLGPSFNVTFCGACHERPTPGGSAALYRNFFISGTRTNDGALLLGDVGGIVRLFHYGPGDRPRPVIPSFKNVFTQRNPIPFFGAGLMAELSDEEIRSREDPDDLDGDGISGRPNFDRGFVGRFGRKAQVVSIEAFIRGPLFNHLGITTDPLSEEQRAALPVDSSAAGTEAKQAAAPDGPTLDDDGAPDPEMSTNDLFDLVSFAMLLALPEPEQLSLQGARGQYEFERIGCAKCHVPRLRGPRGLVPLYSDLLLHDMGEDLADGIEQGVATASEFRTQPLIGMAAVGPYLHDGRASTAHEAILAHGGEAQTARDAYAALDGRGQAALIEFLYSLGGRDQASTGLIAPNTPVPFAGEYGGPRRDLSAAEMAQFIRGRELFDRDFSKANGLGGPADALGGPRFNGDSCRACHIDPVFGGAGPRGVNVIRNGFVSNDGVFSPPAAIGTILHKEIIPGYDPAKPETGINVFEHRQTPPLFGLGLVDAIADATILALEDPDDADADGISGRAHVLPDGRLGRLGWKAQVPDTTEFVRDALGNEMGMTLEEEAGLTFGFTADTDDVPDPEVFADEEQDLAFFLAMLGPPPRQPGADSALALQGEALFAASALGCAKCHVPALSATIDGAPVAVPLYSDLLLHEILPEGAPGIEDTYAGMREFRTAPLWGISQTAPYLHTGAADTLDEAIRLHDGEAAAIRDAYEALPEAERRAVVAFLETL